MGKASRASKSKARPAERKRRKERMSHDQHFKNLILDDPKESMAFFAPSEAEGVLEARVVPYVQEQLVERLGERYRELDVALLFEWPDGRRVALLFLIEQQTEARRFDIRRFAHYCLDVSALARTDRIVPVLIVLDLGGFPQTLSLGGDARAFLEFSFLVMVLKARKASDSYESPNIVERLLLPLMAYAEEEKLTVYLHAQTGLAQLEANLDKRLKYLGLIDKYMPLSDNELKRYEREHVPKSRHKEKLMELLSHAEKGGRAAGRKEGQREGRKAGCKEGQIDGERRLLARLLQRRFGKATAKASEPLLATIEQAGALEDLGVTLLDCADEEAWLGALKAVAKKSK